MAGGGKLTKKVQEVLKLSQVTLSVVDKEQEQQPVCSSAAVEMLFCVLWF